MIEMKNISAGYNKKPVIEKISLTLPNKKLISLIGPNASGKSTLLKTATGILPKMSGEIIIDSEEIILPSTLNASGNLVINLFNDAHLAMGRQAEKHGLGIAMETNGNVRRWFYNTVERDNALESKVNDVPPVVVTYTLEMNSESVAQRFVAGNIDAFIVEGYNGGYWEVHTYPFKTSQVLLEYAGKDLSYYTDNYVWAVQVPATFKYPKEWTSIGAFKNNMLTGAYQTNGHSFGEWATDKTKATDWYNYPTKGMIYE